MITMFAEAARRTHFLLDAARLLDDHEPVYRRISARTTKFHLAVAEVLLQERGAIARGPCE
jgi:hypothetical protein